jgi:hypothetical protein
MILYHALARPRLKQTGAELGLPSTSTMKKCVEILIATTTSGLEKLDNDRLIFYAVIAANFREQ